MSIASEVTRLSTLRDTLRTRAVALGLKTKATAGAAAKAITDTSLLADIVDAFDNLPNNGAVSKTLDASTISYTVPTGWHNGSGKVNIVPESKTVTPTKSAQTITPTAGKVLTSVVVSAISGTYQDVTAVTAAAADVLTGKKIVAKDGTVVTGTMPNLGTVSKTLDGMTTTTVTLNKGYAAGGTVTLTNSIETALAAI